MGKIHAVITGVGGYVPDYVLNNEELSRMVDTSDEWIMTRVGIKERHILTEEGLGTSYMARKAAKQLLKKTGVDPDTIDALIVTTTTPDYKFPSTASIVLGKLGLKNAFAFDLEAACCGFLYSLDVAATMIESGRYKKIIVIGADKMSSLVDYTDRATCVLFLYVHNYLLERKIDALSNSLDDAEVSLVRDNPVDIFCSHLVALEHFLDVVAHVGNGVAEHGASLLIEVVQTVVHCEV